MSDQDSFIEEVTEEVRRDRLFGLWKQYAPFVIGAIVAVVGATAIVSYLDHRAAQAARAAGAALLAAGEEAAEDDRAFRLGDLAALSDDGLSVIAHMQAGAALAASSDRAGAADAFDAAAAGAAQLGEPALSALAAYRAAVLRMDTAAYLDTVGAFSALTTAENPMRLLALEARAVAHANNGEVAAARTDMQAVLDDQAATEGTRQRVRELLATLGAEG